MSDANKTTVTVTFDPTAINRQSDIILGATAQRAGAMTAAQAEKLEGLAPGGGGYPNPTTTHDTVVVGSIAIDGAIENTTHLVALSADATLNVTNPVAGETYAFVVTNAGAFNITWPGNFKWPGGVAPVLTANGVDEVTATYDGASFYAVAALAFA